MAEEIFIIKRFYWLISFSFIIIFLQPNISQTKSNDTEIKLFHDALLTTLNPSISEAIIEHYGYPKQYGLYDIKILEIKRDPNSQFSFTTKLQVNTFDAAHNPPYGKETITFHINPDGVKRLKYIHEGDAYEDTLKAFYNKVISDIKQTFDLKLNGYSDYNYDQIQYKAEQDPAFKSLFDIADSIAENILNSEIHPPSKNIISPVTFIKDDAGYILFKRTDGTNTIFKVKKINNNWEVIDKENKKDKKMDADLLWYM